MSPLRNLTYVSGESLEHARRCIRAGVQMPQLRQADLGRMKKAASVGTVRYSVEFRSLLNWLQERRPAKAAWASEGEGSRGRNWQRNTDSQAEALPRRISRCSAERRRVCVVWR